MRTTNLIIDLADMEGDNKTYYIADNYLPNKLIEVDVHYVSRINFFKCKINLDDIGCYPIENRGICFVKKEYLPESKKNLNLPILLFHQKGQSALSTFGKIRISVLDWGNLTIQLDETSAFIVNEIPVHGKLLQEECQKLTDVFVASPHFPIFNDQKHPGTGVLFDLFKKFTTYNNRNKLIEQIRETKDMCHVRAHFVSLLLAHYNIASLKVFKKFDVKDWENCVEKKNYIYHCATLMFDNDNNKWIWDYESSDKYLLSISQWLSMKNEPEPEYFLPTSSYIIGDYMFGKTLRSLSDKENNLLNFLFFSAIPNHPERPLSYTRKSYTSTEIDNEDQQTEEKLQLNMKTR